LVVTHDDVRSQAFLFFPPPLKQVSGENCNPPDEDNNATDDEDNFYSVRMFSNWFPWKVSRDEVRMFERAVDG